MRRLRNIWRLKYEARLPHLGEDRERVEFRGREYSLSGSETRALATEHYSRGQLDGKARAGFAAIARRGAKAAGKGGTPHDPHHLERL